VVIVFRGLAYGQPARIVVCGIDYFFANRVAVFDAQKGGPQIGKADIEEEMGNVVRRGCFAAKTPTLSNLGAGGLKIECCCCKGENMKASKLLVLGTESPVSQERTRFSVDLTPGAARELGAMKQSFGLTGADVFRFGLLLMRIYAESKLQGKEVHIVDPKNPHKVHVVSLPLFNDSA